MLGANTSPMMKFNKAEGFTNDKKYDRKKYINGSFLYIFFKNKIYA